MKFQLFTFAALLLFPFATILAEEKQPDQFDHQAPATRATLINSSLDASDLIFNRRGVPGAFSATCNAATLATANNPNYYETYTFTANVSGPFEAYCDAPGCTCITDDPMMFLYCYPFDPANPQLNLAYGDDDDGTGCCAAIVPANGVNLVAGQKYVLVVTSFGPNDFFDYTLNIQSDVNLASVPVSNWAIFFGIALIAVFAFVRFRRII